MKILHFITFGWTFHISISNFLNDPKCPKVRALPPSACTGHLSTCWSPGVRDLDCPAQGLCCYDGCANTCYSEIEQSQSLQQQIIVPRPLEIVPPNNNYIPVQPLPPKEEYLPAQKAPHFYPPQTTERYEITTRKHVPTLPPLRQQPSIPLSSTVCPPATPLSFSHCVGRLSTCWSVGVPDLDCPDWGLCCFDGCANVCLGSAPTVASTYPPAQRYEPEPPRNPCDPNPCGLSSMCIPQEGRPFCKCPEGLIPDPTPEIKCSEPRDPCNPSPCGPGTTCTANRDGNPICRCTQGLVPKPDTITGCGPECVVDPDCSYGFICESQVCVEKSDPCDPSPCGPGTSCSSNNNGNPICKCIPGLVPKPDTITGCGPECFIDPDCPSGYICSDQKCKERPDPCILNPCGEGALSFPSGSVCECTCPQGSVGDPQASCHQGNCLNDHDCSADKACVQYQCVDPCLSGTCRATDFCKVVRHQPICGYNYQPSAVEPEDNYVIGQRYSPPKPIEESQKLTVGGKYHKEREEQRRKPIVIGETYKERVSPAQNRDIQMMMMMDTSGLPVIGISAQRNNKVLRRRSRKRVSKY